MGVCNTCGRHWGMNWFVANLIAIGIPVRGRQSTASGQRLRSLTPPASTPPRECPMAGSFVELLGKGRAPHAQVTWIALRVCKSRP